jgi:hypothetical protein
MKTNNWVLFLKQKSKETGISYSCLISNKDIQNEYKKLKMKNEKKIEPIKDAEPYPFSFSVVTNKIIPNDTFNFSRDFKYKTIKTDNGYNFFFKNNRDRDISIDLTQYVSKYKNPKLYKWSYKPVIEPKKVEPKKVEPKKVEPVRKVAPVKKNETEISNIVNNWKDTYISTLLYQSDVYRPFIEHIEKLIEKGSGIANSQLFFRKEDKQLLNLLFEKYGLDAIDDVVRKIVTDLGGISIKNIDGYYKHLDAKNKRKMIKQQSKLL